MRILFDQSAPYKLGRYLEGHSVSTAEESGWARLINGDLLAVAEKDGLDLFLTAEQTSVSIKIFRTARLPLSFSTTHPGKLFVCISLKLSPP